MYPIAKICSVLSSPWNQNAVCFVFHLNSEKQEMGGKKEKNLENSEVKNMHFRKCVWELYIHKSINRVPICAAVHFERCSGPPEVEKYVCFFVNCVPWTKTIWFEMVVKYTFLP